MNGYEAYCVLCEAASVIDEAGLEEGKKTLNRKLGVRGRNNVADNVWFSANQRISAAEARNSGIRRKADTAIKQLAKTSKEFPRVPQELVQQRRRNDDIIRKSYDVINAANRYSSYK